MNRSILNITILVLLLLSLAIVQGRTVCANEFVNTAIYLTDDPNAPGPESSSALGQIVHLSEDPNDGDGGAAE